MKKLMIFTGLFLFACFCVVTVSAVETTQPATHNTNWIQKHGQAAKANEKECFSCHDERIECIACHEDVAPRNHGAAWVQKNHGLESRWNRMNCEACHKQDFCVSCHETSYPINHMSPRFGTANGHCQTSCQLPKGYWKNTPSKNCITCYPVRPITKSGRQHAIK